MKSTNIFCNLRNAHLVRKLQEASFNKGTVQFMYDNCLNQDVAVVVIAPLFMITQPRIALHLSYRIVFYRIVSYCIVPYCIALLRIVIPYCILLYCIVWFRVVSYRIVLYGIVFDSIVLYCVNDDTNIVVIAPLLTIT